MPVLSGLPKFACLKSLTQKFLVAVCQITESICRHNRSIQSIVTLYAARLVETSLSKATKDLDSGHRIVLEHAKNGLVFRTGSVTY
jgi:hypothetical protein